MRLHGTRPYAYLPHSRDPAIISEFYRLRRTAIKDVAAYLGFLVGFIGSAPFAWGLLAVQLDAGRFAQGLWYFFGIVVAAGIFSGIAGLGAGAAAGLLWEQVHRHRRIKRGGSSEPARIAIESREPAPALLPATEQPRLQLVSSSGSGTLRGTGSVPAPDRPGPRSQESGPASGILPRNQARGPSLLRRVSLWDLILAVIVLGMIGLIGELVLLEHTETWRQWIPIVALGAGLLAAMLVRFRPGRVTFLAFRAMMAAFLASGLLGVWFHLAGNVEFAIERTPELSGAALVWKALRGATPALAPGAMVQLALLGLVYAYRHPSLTEKRK